MAFKIIEEKKRKDAWSDIQTDNQTDRDRERLYLGLKALRPLGREEHGASDMCATLSVQ